MSQRAQLIATLTRLPSPDEVSRLPPGVGWLEVRADLLGEVADEALAGLRHAIRAKVASEGGSESAGGLIFTLRSRAEGGGGPDDVRRRGAALAGAGARDDLFDLVDLEAERDLVPEALAAVAPERRILSWHGGPADAAELGERLARMRATPARLYKLVPAAVQAGEELAPLALVRDAGFPADVIAFASGPAAAWTRLLAPRLGAPWVFGGLPDAEAGAPGQIGVDRLVADFGLPELPPVERLFGIAGDPVAHSLSPRLHNSAYRELGIPALYLPFHVERFGDFWLEIVESPLLGELGLPLMGLSVTSPHKDSAVAVSGAHSPRAQAVGGANTLVLSDGVWEAESTDPEGVVLPIRELGVDLAGAAAAVVGAGGAGRSAALGLREAGARVTLFNRSPERGRRAAERLQIAYGALADLAPERFDVVVHATSLGRAPGDPFPFDPARLLSGTVVVDLVYGEAETPLLAAARSAGARVIDGREVLLFQGLDQFRLMTGQELPLAVAREALGLAPAKAAAGEAR